MSVQVSSGEEKGMRWAFNTVAGQVIESNVAVSAAISSLDEVEPMENRVKPSFVDSGSKARFL